MTPAIGYGIRKENRPILDDQAINAAEITFEHAFTGLRTMRFIGQQDFDYVSVHSLELSLAGADKPPCDYLQGLREVAAENGAAAVSDHLGFTRDNNHGIAMGHFAAPPYSRAALSVTCRNIDIVQSSLGGLPFYIENIAYLFQFKGELTEAEFLANVLENTGCGWLLDVTNVYANATNHGYDPYQFIGQVLPSASRVQMHLAGGYYDKEVGLYIDSHSEPIPDDVWKLYQYALEEASGRVDAVFIERDANYPGDIEWRREARQARTIAESVELQSRRVA